MGWKHYKILFIIILAFVVSVFILNNVKEVNPKQWYLFSNTGVNVVEMWDVISEMEIKQKNLTIAVIDTGVSFDLSMIKHRWENPLEKLNGIDDDGNGYVDDLYGWNFCDNSNKIDGFDYTEFENAHGTFIANIICCANTKEVKSIIQDRSVKIMSLKILDSKNTINSGEEADLIEAIKYAENKGARICNLSVDFTKLDENVLSVIEQSEMFFLIAAGNGVFKGKRIDKKNALPNTLVVGSSTKQGEIYRKSNFGEFVDVWAPGVNIYGKSVGDEKKFSEGTSYSTAIVTGVAGTMMLYDDKMTSSECKKILFETAVPLYDESLGDYKLLIDGANALKYLKHKVMEEK